MDWTRYRELSDRPDFWTRWMLEQTLALLDADATAGEEAPGGPLPVDRIAAALHAAPLPKPDDHRGPAGTDMLQLALDGEQAREVAAAMRRAVAAGRRTADGRGLGGFVEAWDEYVRWLDGGG